MHIARADSASHGARDSGRDNEERSPKQGLKGWWRKLTGKEGTGLFFHAKSGDPYSRSAI